MRRGPSSGPCVADTRQKEAWIPSLEDSCAGRARRALPRLTLARTAESRLATGVAGGACGDIEQPVPVGGLPPQPGVDLLVVGEHLQRPYDDGVNVDVEPPSGCRTGVGEPVAVRAEGGEWVGQELA